MIKILIGGDYYPVKEIEAFHKTTKKPSSLFGDLLSEIETVDYAIYNQEYPLTKSNEKYYKYGPNLKGNPICIKAVADAGFNIATLANNHTLDFGEDGMNDTVSVCKQNNIVPIGWGKNLNESRQVHIIEKNGVKVALLNCAENEFNTAKQNSGGAYPLNIIDNTRLIQELKKAVDHIIMIIHGGTDFCHYPSPRMVDQYRFYAENGVSAIIGHHTHHVSGYEVYKGVPIFYSIGNLIYPYTWNSDCQETLVIKFKATKDHLDFKILPYRFSTPNMRLEKIDKESDENFFFRLKKYSEALSENQVLLEKWSEHINSTYSRTVYYTLLTRTPYILHKIARKLKILNFYEVLVKRYDKRMLALWNINRCETHQDAVQYLLDEQYREYVKKNK